MTTQTLIVTAATTAQAAYGVFEDLGTPLPALLDKAGFSLTEAQRLIGDTATGAGPFFGPYVIAEHEPGALGGFSATVFDPANGGTKILSVRGTELTDPLDFAQDGKLAVTGFAGDQAISMYRFYRELTTPSGQPVQYTPTEIELLHRLNNPNSLFPDLSISNAALDVSLASDVGRGVLQPNEPLIVTGHSLGGHLAILFGRLFPGVTQDVYTFNAPGISSLGNVQLTLAGVGPADPTHVHNFVADYGLDIVSAFGTRPGTTERIFIEGTPNGLALNHKIFQLTDSLALYDLLARLSPGLDSNSMAWILAATSRNPGDSLERALDLLRELVAGGSVDPTPVAITVTDAGARDAYYAHLYALRDIAGDHDWQILPLAGSGAVPLGNVALLSTPYRDALAKLSPFVALGGDFDPDLMLLSSQWLHARAQFLTHLLDARLTDAAFGLSGTDINTLFVDVDQVESLSMLGGAAATVARTLTGAALTTYLSNVAYTQKVIFGSDEAAAPDTIDGTSGDDSLFGNAGDDVLSGYAADDLLEGGEGSDTLEGGEGADVYLYGDAVDTDLVSDADGVGTIAVDGTNLSGGRLGADGRYYSGDGLHIYELIGDDLLIDDQLVVAQFNDGDLGIFLTGAPTPVDDGSAATLVGDFETTREDPDPALRSNQDEYGNFLPVGGPAPGTMDILYGLPGDTAIYPLAGVDFVYERWGGNDWIEGGAEADTLYGGPGDDALFADSSDSNIDASPLDDGAIGFFPEQVSGGDGADFVIGSRSPDWLEGGAGADTLLGGNGRDHILGDGIAVFLTFDETGLRYSGGGSIILVGWGSDAYINADPLGAGDDQIDGGLGPDSIVGGSGDDTIDGGPGVDVLDGGPGHDLIITGADGATVYGDGAVDGTGTPLWFDLPYDPAAVGGDDTLIGNGSLYGQAGDDEIRGHGLLSGGSGDDSLIGGRSSETLMGGDGSDYLEGGGGGDLYLVGDGDTISVTADDQFTVMADGGFPAHITIQIDRDSGNARLIELQTDFGFTVVSVGFAGVAGLVGSASDWAGLELKFSDGATSSLAELQRYYQFDPEDYPAGVGPYDPVFLLTTGDDDVSAGEEMDQYFVFFGAAGGHDIIDDLGNGVLTLFDFGQDDVAVFADGDDYLLKSSDSEIRLVGQASREVGIDAILFARDGTVWTRADIESHAIVLPSHSDEVLPVQTGRAGTSFIYALPEGLFSLERVLGDPIYLATALDGSPLPDWLHFDVEHLVLSGTPGNGDAGIVTLALALADESEVLALSPLVINIDPAPEPIFTAGADSVDFNALSDDQVLGLEVTDDVHAALGGDDSVTLPDSTSAAEQTGFVLGTTFRAGSGNDTVVGGQCEDAVDGGAGNDRLLAGGKRDSLGGAAGDDTLMGQGGNDRLQGNPGKDRLDGGAGNDSVQGGGDTDKLTGGTGDDTFVFATVLDSASVLSKADVVLDFEQGSDRIDLSAIDAQVGAGNQTFHFVGAGGLHVAGDLRAYITTNYTVIAGDIDGDGGADFRIRLSGTYTLTEEDFVL